MRNSEVKFICVESLGMAFGLVYGNRDCPPEFRKLDSPWFRGWYCQGGRV